MNSNYYFRNEEDATRFKESKQAVIHDNRHSCPEHGEKQFTVKLKSQSIKTPLDDVVYWSKSEFEDWLDTRDWEECAKQKHRRLFTGCLYFDEDGFFDHI